MWLKYKKRLINLEKIDAIQLDDGVVEFIGERDLSVMFGEEADAQDYFDQIAKMLEVK